MASLFTIELEKLQFHAPHGLYDGEEATGNLFEVSVSLDYAASGAVSSISQTVDYVQAYDSVRRIMQERTDLLETLCQRMADAIAGLHPDMRRVTVKIRKLTPAIAHFSGTVGVSFTKEIANRT